MKRAKKYIKSAKLVNKAQKYELAEAVKLVPQLSTSKFAGSVEISLQLNLTDKQKKESIRGSYTLPNSFGNAVRVLVLCDAADAAKAEGADFVGGDDLAKEIENGKTDFDVVITVPSMMAKIARLGKVLGSKGLMPNPKNGTITTDLASTIKTFKSGKKNYKAGEGALVTAVVGKTDMANEQLLENVKSFIETIIADTKKFSPSPIKSLSLKPTMGPKVNVNVGTI